MAEQPQVVQEPSAVAQRMSNLPAPRLIPNPGIQRGRSRRTGRALAFSIGCCLFPFLAILMVFALPALLHLADARPQKQRSVKQPFLVERPREIRANATYSQLQECFVNTPGESACNHGASLVALSGGALLCSWYAASSEAAPNAQILCSRLEKGAGSWTRPEVIIRPQTPVGGCWLGNKSVGDTVLFLDRDNCLWLFFAGVPFGGWTASHVDFVMSPDLGLHWSTVRRLVSGFSHSPRSKLIELSDGQVMMPLSAWPFRWEGYTVSLSLHRGEILAKSSRSIIPGPENSQPSLLELNNGRVLAYLRNPRGGSLLFSKLDADRQKWSAAKPLNLPSPDSPVDVIECQSGVLIVYTSNQKRRTSMSLAWAADGEHFNKVCDLGDAADVSASYPTIVRSSDGDFHLIYTYGGRSLIKYVRLPREWVRQRIAMTCLGRDNR